MTNKNSEENSLLKKINIIDSVEKLKIPSQSLEEYRKEYNLLRDQFSKKAEEIVHRFGISYDETSTMDKYLNKSLSV
jgi:hypothetical protein